jgi:hypothetical protein
LAVIMLTIWKNGDHFKPARLLPATEEASVAPADGYSCHHGKVGNMGKPV